MMFVSERVLTLGKIVAELYNHDCFFKNGLITENHVCSKICTWEVTINFAFIQEHFFCCQGAKFSSTTSISPSAKLGDISVRSRMFLKSCLLVNSVQKTAGYRFPVAVEKDDKY